MGTWASNTVLDAGLSWIKNNCTQIFICFEQPTTYAEASTGGAYALTGATAVTGADFSAIMSDADGNRYMTVAEQLAITTTSAGARSHVALCSASQLLYVAVCAIEYAENATNIDMPEWSIYSNQPH